MRQQRAQLLSGWNVSVCATCMSSLAAKKNKSEKFENITADAPFLELSEELVEVEEGSEVTILDVLSFYKWSSSPRWAPWYAPLMPDQHLPSCGQKREKKLHWGLS